MAGCLWPDKNAKIDVSESYIPVGDWSQEDEKKLIRRLDNRILLPCFLMMFIGYLDRQNMANAKVLNGGAAGSDSIETIWGLQGAQYNMVISIYGIGLVICEPFSNLLLKKMSAPVWFARIMVTWGAIVMCQAAVKNYAGALATRFFLGVAEAGLLPGVPYYLAFWYTQRERATRMGIAYTGLGTAGMVGGFIAIGVQNINGAGGLYSWQWLFIIEGIPAVLFGVVVYFILPKSPQQAKFLSEAERDIAIRRMPPNAPSAADKIDKADIMKELKDPVMWLFVGAMCFIVIPIAGAAALLPTIIVSLGFTSSIMANGIAAGVNAWAVLCTIALGVHSDWVNERYWHIVGVVGFFTLLGSLPLAITALPSIITTVSGGARLFFLLMTSPISATYPLTWAYRANTSKGTARATINSAITLTAYALGLVVGPQLFPGGDAKLNFYPGLWASFGLYWCGLLCFAFIPSLLKKQAQRAEDAAILGLNNTDHNAVSHEEAKIDMTPVATDVKQAVEETAAAPVNTQ